MSLRGFFYSVVTLIFGLSSTSAEEMNGACLTFPDGSLEVIIDKTCDKETFKGIQLWSECKYSAARTVFQKQALKGDGLAKAALGLMIIQGYDGEPDYEQGIKLLEDGAETGWIEAYFYLAYIYGTPGKHQNYEKAYNYALKAAEKDNGSALIRLSETYMELYAEKKDMTLFREAIRCAYTAGKMGNMQGYDYAAYACFTIHAYNAKESARVLEDLVPLSDDAKGIILEILFSEKQFTECERRAKEFLSQYDYAFARYTLALLYLKHINPEINTEMGLKLMREGADKGDSKSIWGMVCVCENPHLNAPGKKQLKPDYEQALFWYREAEKLDDELSQATAKAWIARYYYEGKGCKRDISYAAKMLHASISLCTTEESEEFLSEVKEKSRKGSKDATEFLKIYNDLK